MKNGGLENPADLVNNFLCGLDINDEKISFCRLFFDNDPPIYPGIIKKTVPIQWVDGESGKSKLKRMQNSIFQGIVTS